MKYAKPAKSQYGKYLFCFFTGNEPENERICFAVSEDGYNFTPLNACKSVITQKTGTLCCRDPYILRGNNNDYYIVATDMKSSLGWDSNHGVVSWHSNDLINWTDECAVDFHCFEAFKNAEKIWAPEAVFDSEKGRFMVYFSSHCNADDALAIFKCYTDDFKSYSEPELLFESAAKKDVIDADIVKNKLGWYMTYKDENVKTICAAVSDRPDGEYKEISPCGIACTDRHVEGNCAYQINGTDTWLIIMDKYADGGYFMQQTEDFEHFLPVSEKDFSLNFAPRHGSMLGITDEEYDRLITHFGGESNE